MLVITLKRGSVLHEYGPEETKHLGPYSHVRLHYDLLTVDSGAIELGVYDDEISAWRIFSPGGEPATLWSEVIIENDVG